jgi:hypothetical protein
MIYDIQSCYNYATRDFELTPRKVTSTYSHDHNGLPRDKESNPFALAFARGGGTTDLIETGLSNTFCCSC